MSVLRDAAAHAFVVDIDAPELTADDRRHLERALRLRVGETVTVCDGAGSWRLCRFTASGLDPADEISVEPRPTPSVTVAIALTKGERLDWAVQKLTELGVDEIVPFTAERSVVRWDSGRADHHVERLRRIARQAAMQSRRTWLAQVADLQSFGEVAAIPGAVLAEPGGGRPTLDRPVVLVGPEGGWAEDEAAAGLPTVGLGATVLRAETAAVAAGTLLCALRAGVVTSGTESP
ncbi:MAG: 16S rRNA (uracil(1498)-N(3))-methyltransferase [Acidimicrobiia bacterium]|nr:16S rRNA (uracil(1498)-N(3))-methyltransferase [Acidimicrobiia bacterium]